MTTETENKDPATEAETPKKKAKRGKADKAAAKSAKAAKAAEAKKAKAAAKEEARMLKRVDVNELRVRLKEKEIAYGSRTGAAKLVELARTAGIDIPEVTKGATGGNVIPVQYRKKYGAAQSCGDAVAEALGDYTTIEEKDAKGKKTKVCSLSKLQAAANANSVDLEKWVKLNIGMQRMNLGNVLRGKVNRGERVVIGSKVWKAKKEGEAEAL